MSKRIQTADDCINKGNSLFVDEQYEEALAVYSEAIDLEADNAEAFLKRSACHYALKNFADAISDASESIKLRPNHAEGYFRKGMGLFAEEEYESAKSTFEKGKSLASDPKKFNLWLRKCDAELADGDDDSMEVVASESAVKATTVPVAQTTAASTSSPSKPPTEPAASSTTSSTTSTQASSSDTVSSEKAAPRYRHEWFQTDTHVSVDLFAKGIKAHNLKVSIEEQNLTITIKLDSGSEFVLDLDLADKVIPAESSYELLSTKIEVRLRKSRVAKWKTLENTGEAAVAEWDSKLEGKPNPASLYPSSRGAKNWDAIAKSDEEEKLSGDHALNKLFKDIYKDATDEQRKAMMKSYVESNGTVLSTNWEEVGSGEVKGSPPAGMEMKSWNEKRDGKK